MIFLTAKLHIILKEILKNGVTLVIFGYYFNKITWKLTKVTIMFLNHILGYYF